MAPVRQGKRGNRDRRSGAEKAGKCLGSEKLTEKSKEADQRPAERGAYDELTQHHRPSIKPYAVSSRCQGQRTGLGMERNEAAW
jgi:hypothetical protein